VFIQKPVFSQSIAEIQNIQFTARNDTLTVTYDIIQAERKELFDISIVVTTASGKLIRPRAVSGDVGSNITGGKGDRILLDCVKSQKPEVRKQVRSAKGEVFIETKQKFRTQISCG